MQSIKKAFRLLVVLGVSAGTIHMTPVYGNTDISLIINKVPVTQGAKPIIKNGSTLVPIRVISETLGASVEWNQGTKQVKINKGGSNIEMTIDNPRVKLNGVTEIIQTAPIVHNGATMLPIRFVGEALNTNVHWDSVTRTVHVTDAGLEGVVKPSTQKDQWGRGIRTTNLPKNAALFPYVVEGVPNWVYEKINMTNIALLSEGSIDLKPKEFFTSGYDLDKAKKILDNHFDHVLNVDYRTINKEEFRSYVRNSFYDRSFESTGYTNVQWADAFVDHVLKQKIVVEGTAKVLPEMFWQTSMGNRVVTAHVTMTVKQQGTENSGDFRDFGDITIGNKIPYMTTDHEYEGLVQFRMIGYDIDYGTNNINSQINPTSNVFGGALKK